MNELRHSIQRNAIGLMLFACVTAGAIALVKITTAERILDNQRQAEVKALHSILPPYKYDNDLLNSTLPISTMSDIALLGGVDDEATLYVAVRKHTLVAVVLKLRAPDAYTRPIDLLLGIYADGKVAGTRVTSHQETPGLGDKIDVKKSNWINTFNGKRLTKDNRQQWAVKKDGGEFDQFTGATVTPRAVVDAVKRGLMFYQRNQMAIERSAQQQGLTHE